MKTEDEILNYTKEYYPNEHELIVKSMINYYTLRMKEEKSEREEMHQQKIYDGVLELFDIMSQQMDEQMLEDSQEIFETLKGIHIKT